MRTLLTMAEDGLNDHDWVRVSGLVGAQHLNDKVGRVETKWNANGRVAVVFVDQPREPKLLKRSNLKLIPEDEDILTIGFPKSNGYFVAIRIENGAGHGCVDCGCDLARRYYVIDQDGQYYCESDYAQKHSNQNAHPMDLPFCAVCCDYIPQRNVRSIPAEKVRRVFPNGKLPNGRLYLGQNDPDHAPVHAACLTCALCKGCVTSPRRAPHGYRTRLIDGRLAFLCAPPLGARDCLRMNGTTTL